MVSGGGVGVGSGDNGVRDDGGEVSGGDVYYFSDSSHKVPDSSHIVSLEITSCVFF